MQDAVRKILTTYKSWAIVGLSSDPSRDSLGVASFLQKRGYQIIPVNPNEEEILGEKSWPDLASASKENDIEVVDVFRKPEAAEGLVREAIDVGAKAVWMQIGVVSEEAFQLATEAGLDVVMDHCPKIELPRLS